MASKTLSKYMNREELDGLLAELGLSPVPLNDKGEKVRVTRVDDDLNIDDRAADTLWWISVKKRHAVIKAERPGALTQNGKTVGCDRLTE